ncbi:Cpn60 TCP1 domain containing protein [Trichuris trichiura]|uniref:Cpn60 TCP1 domain containing protein n=1 Tax=Trichuris trichiura TaxID=36087 RepID=A0A077ZGW6_TRITR|nr:Cpn60 TCP1 domain containing protein [Trichuris trichiura]
MHMAVDAIKLVAVDTLFGKQTDRFVLTRFKKILLLVLIPCGQIEDSKSIKGVVLNKNSTNLKVRYGFLFCEKGVPDFPHYFPVMKNISVIRRIKRTDSDRLANATIVYDPADLTEHDVRTKASEFCIENIGDVYFTFVINDKVAKACTLLLRSSNRDILIEMDRNLQGALHVVCNVFLNAKAKHTDAENKTLDINGTTGEMDDRNKVNVRNPLTVRVQVHKTAIEVHFSLFVRS